MDDRVTAGVGIGITGKQVEKPAFRKEFLPVKVQRKARVKEHVVPYHALDKLRYIAVPLRCEVSFSGSSRTSSPFSNSAILVRPSRYDCTIKEFDSALTALLPM